MADRLEPVATTYTMEALVPGGRVVTHVSVHRSLPAGTDLFTSAQLAAEVAKARAEERERCAAFVERFTQRKRAVHAMCNDASIQPCEVAAAIRQASEQANV